MCTRGETKETQAYGKVYMSLLEIATFALVSDLAYCSTVKKKLTFTQKNWNTDFSSNNVWENKERKTTPGSSCGIHKLLEE